MNDLAILRVPTDGLSLHPLTLGDSSGVQVGDPVLAIGNPFDLERTLTTGVISALQRQITAPNGFAIDNNRTRLSRHLHRLGKQIEHAIQPRKTILQSSRTGGQSRDRPKKRCEVRHEHHQIADSQCLLGRNHPGSELLHIIQHTIAAPIEEHRRGKWD